MSDTISKGDHLSTILAKVGLISLAVSEEDLNVIFYQNMPNKRLICIIGINQQKEKFHRKTTHCHVATCTDKI